MDSDQLPFHLELLSADGSQRLESLNAALRLGSKDGVSGGTSFE